MPPRLGKAMLVAHVATSVAALGAVAGFLALAVAGLTSQDAQTMRAAYVAMDVIARSVIVPLIVAALVTGLVQSLGTKWGLFRHYWVLAKLLLTLFVGVVLLQQMETIGFMARVAQEMTLSGVDHRALRWSLAIHAGGGLLALLVPVALSLYKPRGMTRYGRRKQHARPA